MKTAWLRLIILVLVLPLDSVGNPPPQELSSDPPPDRVVGAAEVYFLKDKNKTRSQVRIYLLGTPEDRKAKKDIVTMDVIFEVEGQKVTKPKYASIAFTVRSADKSKYSKDHNVLIYTDGIEGMNGAEWRTRLIGK